MRDIEQLVSLVYQEASCNEVRPPGPVTLVREMIGAQAISFVEGRGSVIGLPTAPRVRIRRGLHGVELCMAFGRAAAVVAFARHCPGETMCEERLAPLAAGLIMPGPAVRATVRAVGPREDAIARVFVVPSSIAKARLLWLGIGLKSGQYLRVVRMQNAG